MESRHTFENGSEERRFSAENPGGDLAAESPPRGWLGKLRKFGRSLVRPRGQRAATPSGVDGPSNTAGSLLGRLRSATTSRLSLPGRRNAAARELATAAPMPTDAMERIAAARAANQQPFPQREQPARDSASMGSGPHTRSPSTTSDDVDIERMSATVHFRRFSELSKASDKSSAGFYESHEHSDFRGGSHSTRPTDSPVHTDVRPTDSPVRTDVHDVREVPRESPVPSSQSTSRAPSPSANTFGRRTPDPQLHASDMPVQREERERLFSPSVGAKNTDPSKRWSL